MTATKNVKSLISKNDYPAAVDHNAAMIEELRADPDYANAYLANALEEINESGGLGGFLVALRQVIEARGGISEAAKNLALPVRVSTVHYPRTETRPSQHWHNLQQWPGYSSLSANPATNFSSSPISGEFLFLTVSVALLQRFGDGKLMPLFS